MAAGSQNLECKGLETGNAMEKEFMKEDICTLLTPAKPVPVRPVLESINGRMENHLNGGSPTKRVRIYVDFEDLISLDNNGGLYNCEAATFDSAGNSLQTKASDTINIPANPLDGIPYEAKEEDEIEEASCSKNESNKLQIDENSDSVGLASPISSTPLKRSSRKRHNSGMDLNKKPRQKPRLKRHIPKVLDENKPKRTPKAKMPKSALQPQTPPKRATSKPRVKRSCVRNNSFKLFSNSSEDVVEGHADKSCKRALNFSMENQAEDGCNFMEDDNRQEVDPIPENSNRRSLNLNLDGKGGKLFVYQYQRQNKRVKNIDLNSGICEPGICTKVNNNISVIDTTARSNQNNFTNSEGCIQTGCMSLAERKDGTNQTGCKYSSLQVYQRIFKVNQCLRNSRKSGPNFPRIYKKRRMRRRKATVYKTWGSVITAESRGRQSKGKQKVILVPPNRKVNPNKIRNGVKKSKLSCSSGISSCDRQMQEMSVRMISPMEEQTRAAMNDPESFICVMALQPVVKWKRNRSKRLTKRCNFVFRSTDSISNQLPSTHLLQDFSVEKQMPAQLTDKEKVTKRRQNKLRPSLNNQVSFKDSTLDSFLDVVLQKFKYLSISEKYGQLVVQDPNVDRTIVPYEGKFNPLTKRKSPPKIDLDQESERVWALLMANGGSSYDEEAEADPVKKAYWARERHVLEAQLRTFITILRRFQGDRRFSKWRGSVVDAVVGAYLTQNVSDLLSSSAFMFFIARFPPQNSIGRNKDSEAKESEPYASVSNAQVLHDCFIQEVRTERRENEINSKAEGVSRRKKTKAEQKKENTTDWDNLRRTYCTRRARTEETMDAVDWEAVRRATVEEVADTIKQRGMNNILAGKIKDFLDRLVEDHGSIDLEWLRDVPPKDAKDYLLSIYGIGLKSVECIRLLTLGHVAFPVDTNVGRVAVRLGWVPLQPLPESLQLHLLESYPMVDTIQKYLYPRLCTLGQAKMYELHYHLITFGKVFCTKRKPNCNACPMRGECKHFSSAFASARLALPAPESKNMATSNRPVAAVVQSPVVRIPLTLDLLEMNISDSGYRSQNCEPIVELPASPEPESELEDIEDLFKESDGVYESNGLHESDDDIPIVRLDTDNLRQNILDYVEKNKISLQGGDLSKAWALLNSPAALPKPKLKHVGRLRTIHQVYELPDSHPLLEEVDRREPDDPCPYLFAIWEEGVLSGKTGSSFSQTMKDFKSSEPNVCQEIVCSSSSNLEEHNFATVYGTLLIPCRTANKGKFPLNGTYFQINEVFADDESTQRPIIVPRNLIWGLPKRVLYCGTSATTIFKGLPIEQLQHAFWRGFMCARGFNRKTRYPSELGDRFHIKTSMQGKTKPTRRA